MKDTKKTCALYDPYLGILGGGERYVLSILKVFENKGFHISVFSDKPFHNEIRKKFGLNFQNLHFIPNIFKNNSPIQKLQNLSKFDYFIYVTDGSYFFSGAKKNYIYAMVPQQSLYSKNILNRIKTLHCIFITHSQFTRNHLENWGIQSKLLYPYIPLSKTISLPKKEKIIVSVGRFFKHLHSKRHDLAIQTFSLLKKSTAFRDYRLVVVGGLQKEDQRYFSELKTIADKDASIELKPNISYDLLVTYYKKSMFYWHFAGFGIDENRYPELVEHMGITPIEAMAYGSIPFCYAAGGPKEIITQGRNGFLFKSEDELMKEMTGLVTKQNAMYSMQKRAMEFVAKNFGYPVFEKNVVNLFQL